MTQAFSAPASATGVPWTEVMGALLLIDVSGFEPGIVTTFGPSDAVRADVVVLDGPNKGDTYEDTLIFGRALVGQLRPKVGGKVLGRLGQGVAKAGQNPPWSLSAPTPADEAVARAFLSSQFGGPAKSSADEEAPF